MVWRQKAILDLGRWGADRLRDIVRNYVGENLAAQDAVMVIDQTGLLQGIVCCCTLIYGLGGQDYELLDWSGSPPMYGHAAMPLSIVRSIRLSVAPAIR